MNRRLLSLDVMRGLTVMAMIIVNNGAGGNSFDILCHSVWNGLTPCDLVFPFFLFMVGVSITFSLSKQGMSATPKSKIVSRTLKLFLIGVALHAFDAMTKGVWNPLPELRVWGVLQRIALCYFFGCSILICYGRKQLLTIALTLLSIYGVMILCFKGYEPTTDNIIACLDRAVCGSAHLYKKSPIDPEGLLSTLPSIAHTLIGIYIGFIIQKKEELSTRLVHIFFIGAALMLAGWLLQFGMPLNKRIWSPSYTLMTCGMATTLLSMLTYLIDARERRSWTLMPQMFGQNAFFIYVLSEMFSSIVRHTGIADAAYSAIYYIVPLQRTASLIYSILFCSLMALPAWALWKKKIFIKI